MLRLSEVLKLALIIISTSCGTKEESNQSKSPLQSRNYEIEYYNSGNIKSIEFFKEGKLHGSRLKLSDDGYLKEQAHFHNGVMCDSEMIYYPNGEIRSESKFFIQSGSTIFKEQKVYDRDGKIDKSESFYLEISNKSDTVTMRDSISLNIEIGSSIFKEIPVSKRFMKIVYGDLDSQFRILNPSSLDTIPGDKSKGVLVIKPKQIGENVVRGFVIDGYEDDYMEPVYGRQYFEKHYYVKSDTMILTEYIDPKKLLKR